MFAMMNMIIGSIAGVLAFYTVWRYENSHKKQYATVRANQPSQNRPQR